MLRDLENLQQLATLYGGWIIALMAGILSSLAMLLALQYWWVMSKHAAVTSAPVWPADNTQQKEPGAPVADELVIISPLTVSGPGRPPPPLPAPLPAPIAAAGGFGPSAFMAVAALPHAAESPAVIVGEPGGRDSQPLAGAATAMVVGASAMNLTAQRASGTQPALPSHPGTAACTTTTNATNERQAAPSSAGPSIYL